MNYITGRRTIDPNDDYGYLDENGEYWEGGTFYHRFDSTSTPQREIWIAVHMNNIHEVQRLLAEASSHEIFTYINVRRGDSFVLSELAVAENYDDEMDHIVKETKLRNVTMTAASLGYYTILDLIVTAHPSSIFTCSKVCFKKSKSKVLDLQQSHKTYLVYI